MKWEYAVKSHYWPMHDFKQLEEEMTFWGIDGWELVTVQGLTVDENLVARCFAFYKRPLDPEPTPAANSPQAASGG